MSFGYNVYFTERHKNRVLKWSPDTGQSSVIVGNDAEGDDDQSLRDPYGLALDHDGNLLIADKLNHRIVRFRQNKLEQIITKDMGNNRNTRSPRQKDRPDCPTSIFPEKDGNLLVAYSDDYTIYRVHGKGRLELVLGIPPGHNGMLTGAIEHVRANQVADVAINLPTAVAEANDGTIFFIERGYQVVRWYHPSDGFHCIFPISQVGKWPKSRNLPNEMPIAEYHPVFPTGLVVGPDELLYMADAIHRCIWQVDIVAGTMRLVVKTKGREGEDKGGGPSAINFGPDGILWILDTGSGQVMGAKPSSRGPWDILPQSCATIYESLPCVANEGAGIVCG